MMKEGFFLHHVFSKWAESAKLNMTILKAFYNRGGYVGYNKYPYQYF